MMPRLPLEEKLKRAAARAKRWRTANPDKVRAMRKRYNASHKEKVRMWNDASKARHKEHIKAENSRRARKFWLKGYGLTADDYDALVIAQDSQCGICLRVTDDLCVDHDHATGRVRSLLCRTCNLGLGSFKDSIANLLVAAEYLKVHQYAAIEFLVPEGGANAGS